MNRYLIFRTDRIGDFLISAILIKCIKINDPEAYIIVVSSKKNYSYIKNYPLVNSVLEFRNNFFSKINLIFKLKKNDFTAILIHDNKKRSKFISFFLDSKEKIFIENPDQYSHIELIKIILKKLNFSFFNDSLNLLSHNKEKISSEDIVQLHFDEKWIHNSYIKKFVSIEPKKNELITFIKEILIKTQKKLVITTGLHLPKIFEEVLPHISNLDIKIYENLNFLELENVTLRSKILISCHGAISHVAAANKIKQIDIIDKSYNYNRWTDHFRNYSYLYRDKFELLSKKIIEQL